LIPSGDVLQPFLRLVTLKSMEMFAALAGLPHSAEGFLVHIGSQRYIVADACSGLSYVTLAVFLCYSFGLLLYRSNLKVLGLTLFGAFLGMASNALRVNAIVTIDWLRGSQMDLSGHGALQWAALFIALGVLFLALTRLRADAPATAHAPSAPPSPAVRPYAPVVAGLLVLGIVGGFLALPIDQPRAPRSAQAAPAPDRIQGWQLTSSGAWMLSPDQQSESLTLAYRRQGKEMQAHIVETLTPTGKLPQLPPAPAETGWREGGILKRSACIDSRCLTLLHATWQRTRSREQRHVFYTYSIGDFATHSALMLRVAHGWHRLTGEGDSPRLTALTFGDGAVPPLEEVAAALLAVQSALPSGYEVRATARAAGG